MSKLLKLMMGLALVFTFVGCTVESEPVLQFNYMYTSYCEGTGEDACEDLDASSYVRIIGDLIVDGVVTIEAYLPGDEHPYLSEQFVYNGRQRDALGTYYDFYSVSEYPKTSFAVYDGAYASFYEEEHEDWMYNFSNDPSLYKKAAK